MSARVTIYTTPELAELLADIGLRLDPEATTELYYNVPEHPGPPTPGEQQ